MKRAVVLFMTFLMAVCLGKDANAQATATPASLKQGSSPARKMAIQGEKVWVIINHIKADKRQQFEKFIHEVFWPMAAKLTREEQKIFKQTRVLHPTGAEEDGTYSYVFIMDPFIEGADYEIDNLLKKMYGAEKAAGYSKMFGETFAREQTQLMVVQSPN